MKKDLEEVRGLVLLISGEGHARQRDEQVQRPWGSSEVG